jgi:cyanophycinase
VSIHLVGGGWADDYDGEVYREFVVEAAARALASGRDIPRIAVLLVQEDALSASDWADKYRDQLLRVAVCEPVVTAIVEGELFTSSVLSGIDGLFVGGGLTPAYLDAVAPIVEEVRMLVADSLPYLGLSAAMAAPTPPSSAAG